MSEYEIFHKVCVDLMYIIMRLICIGSFFGVLAGGGFPAIMGVIVPIAILLFKELD